MQGRKLNLKPYEAQAGWTENDEPIMLPYKVKESLVEILFHDDLKLDHKQVIEANDLAERILAAETDELVVSEQDFGRIRGAIEKLRSLHRRDVEFVKRFDQATVERVELAEKK